MNETNQNNPMAMGSLISSLVAWVIGGLGSCALTFFFPPVAFCTWVIFLGGSVVAVIFGHMGRSQIKAGGNVQGGKGLATTGLALGWAGVAANVLIICLIVGLVVAAVTFAPDLAQTLEELMRELEVQ